MGSSGARRDVHTMNRRLFLQGIGGVALAVPFLSTRLRESRAATSAPKRLVLFHTHGGCITTRWFPQVENGPLTATDLAATTLDVFAPVVGKLLLPRGITAINGMARPQIIDPHVQAMGSKLTCSLIDEQTRLASSHSLDHEVARQLNASGVGPLYVNPGWSFADSSVYLSFAGANEPSIPVTDAWSIYAQLTTNVTSSSTRDAGRTLMKQSALDVVRDDLTRLQGANMGQSDRQLLQQWMELLRQTEANLGNEAVSCSTTQLAELNLTEARLNEVSDAAEPDAATRISVRGDVLMDLMALTMICNANRALLFSYPGFMRFDWDGIVHDADIDGLNHRTGTASTSGECYPDVLAKLLHADRWYASKFYRLVALLAGIPEGETNLLDNTATLWLREFSDGGALNLNNLPLLIAGSCGGYLKQGAAVLVEDEPVGPGNSEAACTEPGDIFSLETGTESSRGVVPINKLYVTLMNAVGCYAAGGGPVTEFGVFDGTNADAGITDPGELTALRA
jgi:Protein of unknown function (DUF1552)